VGRAAEPFPETPQQVHELALWLATRTEFPSCEHPEFTADHELLFCSLYEVAIAQEITAHGRQVDDLLAEAIAGNEARMLDGLDVLGARMFTFPPCLARVIRWSDEARSGAGSTRGRQPGVSSNASSVRC
jgi:hypothetical protein